MHRNIWLENVKERIHMKGLGVDGRLIDLLMVMKGTGSEGVD
jgi:hypothetical protein